MDKEEVDAKLPLDKTIDAEKEVQSHFIIHIPKFKLPSLFLNTQELLKTSRSWRRIIAIVAVLVLFGGAYFAGSHATRGSTGLGNTTETDTQILLGRVALSETELRAVVVRNHLDVYWAGPMKDALYTIYTPKPNVTLVRYLTNGEGLRDAQPNYRVIASYGNQLGVFGGIQEAGKKPGNLGYINIDGNAVFYVRTRPTNVYMAIQGKDTQVEIFDPGADQAVALSLFRGQISRIT